MLKHIALNRTAESLTKHGIAFVAARDCTAVRGGRTLRAIGIDLGGHNTKAALVIDGTIQERLEEATAPGRRQEEVCAQVARLAEALSPAGEVVPVGLGVPGMLDSFREHIKKMPNFPNWEGVPLKTFLEERLSRPVAIENDANCYALGEGWAGAAKGLSSYVVITLGTGVGGGIVLDGKLLKGAHGMAGELGHIAIGKDEYCGCGGRGHLEAISGADALERLARSWGIPDDPRLWRERKTLSLQIFGTWRSMPGGGLWRLSHTRSTLRPSL